VWKFQGSVFLSEPLVFVLAAEEPAHDQAAEKEQAEWLSMSKQVEPVAEKGNPGQ
jgi:hypothetical protein